MAWEWDDAAFCRRVVRLCEERGLKVAPVLKQARLAHDYLQTKAKRGRRIDRLGALAVVLGVEVGELLGLPPSPVDAAVLLRAYRAAREIGLADEGEFVRVMAAVYRALCAG